MAEVILPCTCGPTNNVVTALSGFLPIGARARRDQPLRGVHGCRGDCVANPIGTIGAKESGPFIGPGRVIIQNVARLDGLPFPPRSDARAIMSPRRPTLTTSLPAIAARAAHPLH